MTIIIAQAEIEVGGKNIGTGLDDRCSDYADPTAWCFSQRHAGHRCPGRRAARVDLSSFPRRQGRVDRRRACGLVVKAVERASEKSSSAKGFVSAVATLFRAGAEQMAWTEGCPVAATTIEGDRQSPAVRKAVAANFHAWQEAIACGLRQHGRSDAESEALMILGALEGGLLLARGLRSPEPYDAAVALLHRGLAAPA